MNISSMCMNVCVCVCVCVCVFPKGDVNADGWNEGSVFITRQQCKKATKLFEDYQAL